LVRRYLKATDDSRTVIEDAHAPYFGAELESGTLMPGVNPRLGSVNFDAWFAQSNASR